MDSSRQNVSTKDESIRLFKNDFLNALTKVHPVTPLVIFLPAISYWLYLSGNTYHLTVTMTLSLMAFGLFFWTLFEYSLHRFVFHLNFKAKWLKTIHFLFHGIHHDYPSDSRRLVMPPSVSIPLAAVLYWAGSRVLPTPDVPAFFAGFFAGYLFYDMSHFAIHHWPVKNPVLLAIRRHHFRHHFKDPDNNYGVSSALWDYVFATFSESSKSKRDSSQDQVLDRVLE